jgi:hypothetical protein
MTETGIEQPTDRWVELAGRFRRWSVTPAAKWLWRVIGAVSFIVINGYMAYVLIKDWNQVRTFDWLHPNLAMLGVTALVQSVGMVIAVYIWGYVVNKLGYGIGYRQHFRAYALSFLAQKLPGIGWSIISKVYLYGNAGVDKVQMAVASGMEHVVGGISGATAALIVMLLLPSGVYFQPLIPLAAIALFGVILVLPPVRRGFEKLNARNAGGALRWPHVVYWTAVTTAVTLLGGLTLYFFCRGLGVVEPGAASPLMQAWALFIFAGALLFWMPVDIGLNAAILIFVLSSLVPASEAVLVLIAFRFWNNLIIIAWSLAGLLLTRKSKSAPVPLP